MSIDLSLIVTVLSIVIVLFAFILGLIRGRNRSILRFIFVVISAVVAILLRKTVVDFIMGLQINGDTIPNTILSSISTGAVAIPDSLNNLLLALIEIIIGLVAYYLVFWVVLFLTWLIIYPIFKLFIKKGKKKGVLFGGLVGIIQGVVVAILSLAPVSGLILEVNKISHIQLQGKDLFTIPADIGVEKYLNSTVYKIYDKTGYWLFDMMSTTDYEGIEDLKLGEIIDTTASVMKVAGLVGDISGNIQNMNPDLSTPQTQVATMKSIGDTLIEVGTNLDNLSENSKALVNSLIDVVKDLIVPEGETLPPEIDGALNDFVVGHFDLVGAGNAIKGIATYIEKKTSDEFTNDEPLSQLEVNAIVNGLASNPFLIHMIAGTNGDGKLTDVSTENEGLFETAIDSTTLTQEDKDALKVILGVN
ncbi:MAG: CvpA family protein [Clostridia bacterium]|nr:CvpA family protein [Clostridia bacterium]